MRSMMSYDRYVACERHAALRLLRRPLSCNAATPSRPIDSASSATRASTSVKPPPCFREFILCRVITGSSTGDLGGLQRAGDRHHHAFGPIAAATGLLDVE